MVLSAGVFIIPAVAGGFWIGARARLVRGLSDRVLRSDAEIDVIAEAGGGSEGIELATRHRINVALVDVQMPRLDGIATTRALRGLPPPPHVIVLTTFDLDQYVDSALSAGADGFLLKDAAPTEILRALHLVAAGSAMLDPAAARRVIDRYRDDGDTTQIAATRMRIATLTPREQEVLHLLALGQMNAATMYLSACP